MASARLRDSAAGTLRPAVGCVALCLLLLSACSSVPVADSSNQTAQVQEPTLRGLFRSAYDEAIAVHRQEQILAQPVIIQDLLGMTLLRTNGERIRYEMDKSVYFLLADNTHPPYGIYSIIALNGYGTLEAEQLRRLAEYRLAIQNSLDRLDENPVDAEVLARLRTILFASRDFIDAITDAGVVSLKQFEDFVEPLRPLFDANFRLAAEEQLRQFRSRMETFRIEYPEDKWSELRVVVMGFHQPRELWTLKQFFQWLLDEPGYEKRVVYAEFQYPFFGESRPRAEQLALELLTKVDFDLSAARVFLGDETLLGRDILGPYARDILETWDESSFQEPQ